MGEYMLKKEEIIKVLDLLDELYPEAECALDFQNNYQLLIAVVLSAQTTDVSVNKVTPKLFDVYPEPEDLANANPKDVENILRTIGMYKTKSRNIISLANDLVNKFESQVPEDYDLLISMAGVGRKTANVVLSVGFGHQRIAVDTHVFRVSNRLGIVNKKDVLSTELALMKKLPEDRWSKAHHSLIFHGRNYCTARNPRCDECILNTLCLKRIK